MLRREWRQSVHYENTHNEKSLRFCEGIFAFTEWFEKLNFLLDLYSGEYIIFPRGFPLENGKKQ